MRACADVHGIAAAAAADGPQHTSSCIHARGGGGGRTGNVKKNVVRYRGHGYW